MFHFINRLSPPAHWDSIVALVNSRPDTYLTFTRDNASDPMPGGIPASKWAYRASATYWKNTYGDTNTAGEYLASQTVAALTNLGAARVIWDEIRGPHGHARSTVQTCAHAANVLGTHWPHLNGRWGATIEMWNGNAVPTNPVWGYDSCVSAINHIFARNGFIAVQCYINKSGWCANGDGWMRSKFMGGDGWRGGTNGLPYGAEWLVAHRNMHYGDVPNVSWLIDPTQRTMISPNPHYFLDREMWYCRNQLGGLNFMAAALNGGIGSWIWQGPLEASGGGNGYTVVGRDAQFAEYWNRYCAIGASTPQYSVQC